MHPVLAHETIETVNAQRQEAHSAAQSAHEVNEGQTLDQLTIGRGLRHLAPATIVLLVLILAIVTTIA